METLWSTKRLLRPSACKEWGKSFMAEYESPRLVTVRSRRIGIFYRFVQVTIITYLVGYVFLYSKGYQEFEMAESSVVTKTKGLMYYTDLLGRKEIWDHLDFVVPSQETNAFFVATNFLYTVNQSRGNCTQSGTICSLDKNCTKGRQTRNGHQTGRCIDSSCEVTAWCPVENEEGSHNNASLLEGFESVTVLVKNHIAFPNFGVKRRNILDSVNDTYLSTCRYHNTTDLFCPVFSIPDILKMVGQNFSQIAQNGGIIAFDIQWVCDLDYDEELCVPRYSFRRLDDEKDKIARGWNFRHAYYYEDAAGTPLRDVVKLWGIRFVFHVHGIAGKFSPLMFFMNLGSGLGLLGVASVVCEFVLLHCFQNNQDLLEQKFTRMTHLSLGRTGALELSTKPPKKARFRSQRSKHSVRNGVPSLSGGNHSDSLPIPSDV